MENRSKKDEEVIIPILPDSQHLKQIALAKKNTFDYRKLIYFFSIIFFFSLYGIMQEKIMTTPYKNSDLNGEEEFFSSSAFLVLMNRIISLVTSLAFMFAKKESFAAVAPYWCYAVVSFCNIAATFCQYEALKFLNFPTQTLGKNGKLIPTLLFGRCLLGKKYTWKDYVVFTGVILGCTFFMLGGDIHAHRSSESENLPLGILIMLLYLCFDGFTSTFQEKLFRGYSMSTHNQMFYVNAFSMGFSFAALTLSGEMLPSIEFSRKHPDFLFDSISLSLCATAGQQMIYTTIKAFGNVVYSAAMTVRQLVSIILSSIVFEHNLTYVQWFSAMFVFICLFQKL